VFDERRKAIKKGKRVRNRRRRRSNGATGVKERKVGRRHTLLRMIRVFYFLVAAFTKPGTYHAQHN